VSDTGKAADRTPLEERAAAALTSLLESDAVPRSAEVESFSQLQGGWSRHSYVLTVRSGGELREYVIRVRPEGALLDTSLRQEFLTYRLLGRHGVRAPAVYTLEEGVGNPFGGPFFTMEKVGGKSPNVWRAEERESLEANWSQNRSLGEDLVQSLAAIHAIPESEVAEILPRRDLAAALAHWRGVQDEMALVSDPVIAEAYRWLGEQEVGDFEPALVHGDYRLGNCMIEGGRVVAILDWELAYFGDPRFDLGYVSLDYHAGKFTRPGSRLLNAVAERKWFMRRYGELSGKEIDPEVVRVYSVLGALILLAILTTAVRMYADGQTTDVRMVWSRFAIPGLRQDITRLLHW
jgi:aminoglycoside phosphotransferase (APT) family kinase protein